MMEENGLEGRDGQQRGVGVQSRQEAADGRRWMVSPQGPEGEESECAMGDAAAVVVEVVVCVSWRQSRRSAESQQKHGVAPDRLAPTRMRTGLLMSSGSGCSLGCCLSSS